MPIRLQVEEQPTLNLTAMLDVMFLLILFFVLNTKFLDDERKIEVRVPQVANSRGLAAAAQRTLINIDRSGTITLDETPVTLEQLPTRLAAAGSRSGRVGVLVRGDGEGQFQTVAAVLSACKQAGVADLGISVRPAPVRR